MDGRVVKPLARKTKKCRKSGMVRTRTMLTAKPRGDGLRRAFATSANRDMIRGDLCMPGVKGYARSIMYAALILLHM
jgi:hypothetical protein